MDHLGHLEEAYQMYAILVLQETKETLETLEGKDDQVFQAHLDKEDQKEDQVFQDLRVLLEEMDRLDLRETLDYQVYLDWKDLQAYLEFQGRKVSQVLRDCQGVPSQGHLDVTVSLVEMVPLEQRETVVVQA